MMQPNLHMVSGWDLSRGLHAAHIESLCGVGNTAKQKFLTMWTESIMENVDDHSEEEIGIKGTSSDPLSMSARDRRVKPRTFACSWFTIQHFLSGLSSIWFSATNRRAPKFLAL